MQIHELNEFIGALGDNAYMAIDNGQDTGKLAFTDLFTLNGYKTLWTGEARAVDDEIDLEEPISEYEFIDVYYEGVGNRSISGWTRIPVEKLSAGYAISSFDFVQSVKLYFNAYYTALQEVTDTKLKILSASQYYIEGDSAPEAHIMSFGGITIKRIEGVVTPGNAKGVVAVRTAVLAAGDWADSSQTVEVEDVTEINSVLVCPTPSSQTDAMAYGVNCVAQGNGTLTFSCSDTPVSDITYNIMIVG